MDQVHQAEKQLGLLMNSRRAAHCRYDRGNLQIPTELACIQPLDDISSSTYPFGKAKIQLPARSLSIPHTRIAVQQGRIL